VKPILAFPIALIGLASAACRSATRDGGDDTVQPGVDARNQSPGVAPTETDPAGAARAKIGVIFDPGRVRPGDVVGRLAVDRVAVGRAVDSSLVGSIGFKGEIELSGRTIRHPDADASDAACFEANSFSAARLPRWAGDRRRAWFCFSNAQAARRALGSPPPERNARILLSEFVINRGMSDQVNSARLVRVLGPIPDTSKPSTNWVVTENGIAKLRAGMTIADAKAAYPSFSVPAGDPSACSYAKMNGLPSGVAVMVEAGKVARVEVRSGSVATSTGARIGDSEARIKSLYPNQVAVTPHKYESAGHYLTVTPSGSANRIIFETDGKRVTNYRAGARPQVEYVERCG